MTAPTWLRILLLRVRMRILFLFMDLDTDPKRRAWAWLHIVDLHDIRDSLRAERAERDAR